MAVGNALVENKWYENLKTFGRNLIVMLARAQKPYVLKIAFFTTSLEGFTDVSLVLLVEN